MDSAVLPLSKVVPLPVVEVDMLATAQLPATSSATQHLSAPCAPDAASAVTIAMVAARRRVERLTRNLFLLELLFIWQVPR